MTRILISLTFLLLGCGMAGQKNSMTLDELLTQERSQYITTYQLGIKNNKSPKSATEVMLQTKADQNRELPELYQIYRYDMINVNAEGKYNLVEFNIDKDSVLSYDRQVYEINGMKITIDPIVWNGCEFTLDKKPTPSFDYWAKKWMDIDDKKTRGSDSLQHVIHNVTFPVEEDGKWNTSIDFGSAPIEAFKELLSTFSSQGIKSVEVHSKAFAN